ncbi:hypothetical protein DAPPUDRAFT_114421 [Daphnia pulex]|uniref:Uncharacterized protein n=1 Tax=Daphnia pulex TaxID=6669 RepID=E9HI34_DAPPU|nr:hypothetical protein DAPPUDRAFT_114421 [Daphnia pulex]|eukprot:EFX68586.1 hypothetical protein DAPPUDRAFT_114421 [Daphnia pulex]
MAANRKQKLLTCFKKSKSIRHPDPAAAAAAGGHLRLELLRKRQVERQARILLADCSRYDSRADQGATAPPPHLDVGWPSAAEASMDDEESDGCQGQQQRQVMQCDSPAAPAPAVQTTDIKSMLGIVPAASAAADGITESAKVNQHHQHDSAAGPTVVNTKGQQQQQQQRVPVSVVCWPFS